MAGLRTCRREALLVIRAQLGDREAVETLLTRTASWLRPYLSRLLGDAHRAEDVAQDALVIAWRRLRHVHEPRAWRAWVYRIATREAFRAIRRAGPATLGPDPALIAAPAAPSPPDPADVAGALAEIDDLPPNSRAVAVLHYLEGLSLRHVAAVLDVPEGTVKSRLAYALDRLRGRLGALIPPRAKG